MDGSLGRPSTAVVGWFGRDNKSGDFNLLIEVGLFACSLDGGRGEKREKNVAVNVQPPFKRME
jgi:hypothetical protein